MLFLRTDGGVNFTGSSVMSLFMHNEDVINKIPESERFNLHYTLCECHQDDKPRQFYRQNIIPFDIDGVDTSRIDDYLEPVLDVLGVHRSDTGIVNSGNGLHFLIGLETYIEDAGYFKDTKEVYKTICSRINTRLKNLGLPGEADSMIWSAGHTLRLPGTKNIKTLETGYKNKNSVKDCVLLQRIINPLPETSIYTIAKLPEIKPEQTMKVESVPLGGTFPVDNKGVLNGCDFIKWCKESPDQVNEPLWHALISNLARLENGRELVHQYSQGHADYDYDVTEEKIDATIAGSPPITCETIQYRGFDCTKCKNFLKCKSPISIRSEQFIKTKESGFREMVQSKSGDLVRGKVATDDLVKYFEQQHSYIVSQSKSCYTWTGTHWEMLEDVFIENFAERYIEPSPRNNEVAEFTKKVLRRNVVTEEWFTSSTEGKLNLKNGVYELKTDIMVPHSKDFGFEYCLDYDYDMHAKCPRWLQFIEEVTLNRESIGRVLQEFMGYAFSNDECEYDKALILSGYGANGKSKFINIFQALAGENNSYTGYTMDALKKENNVVNLRGKLFNLSEETPTKSIAESSTFKNLVSGGTTTGRLLYKNSITFTNKAKIIMAANELPYSNDGTYGFTRRLIIIPFDARFTKELGNRDTKIVDKLKLELPGILNWVIEGYRRLQKQGDFTYSEELDGELEEYSELNDPVKVFVKENLFVKEWHTNGDGIMADRLYRLWTNYCEDIGLRINYSLPTLSKKMKPIIKDLMARKVRRGGSSAVYRGIFEHTNGEGPEF